MKVIDFFPPHWYSVQPEIHGFSCVLTKEREVQIFDVLAQYRNEILGFIWDLYLQNKPIPRIRLKVLFLLSKFLDRYFQNG